MPRLVAIVSLLVLFSGPPAGAAPNPKLVWIETERFEKPGGWTCDWQFVDQMGSPYLMAIGLGRPVADAATTVRISQPGAYRVWLRTRDWYPKDHPGRFQLLIGGKTLPKEFGASGRAGWQWEDAGVHELPQATELRLHDLTGYYARCDAVVLAGDTTWTPPDDRAAIERLRLELGAVSAEVTTPESADVVVVGGGLAGCVAAVASARGGARTVLLQNRGVLGGNASVEILVPPVGFWLYSPSSPLDPHETGIVEEFRTKGTQKTEEVKVYSGRLERLVGGEPRLKLYRNVHVTGVEMAAAGRISAVLALEIPSGRRLRFPAKIFCDCTGESTVGVAAGAEYRHGREPRSMYQEPMAPEVADRQTMGNSLKYVGQPAEGPQPYTAPSWAMKFPRCEDFTPGRHPRLEGDIQWQWMIELGGTQDTFRDAEEIRDDLLRLIYGMWDHVKNHCPQAKEKAANYKLAWVAHVAGKRENRRLVGDYVLTQNDIGKQVLFPDRVAYGGWGLDDHFPQGFFYNGPPAQHTYKALPHSIPYRSLYSKNVENLLMAGRNISASHVAMSATRVMLTTATMGQAIGTASALCVRHETTPQGVYQNYLHDLQQTLLKDGAHLIDLANDDPHDLALRATASASSSRPLKEGGVLDAGQAIDGHGFALPSKRSAWSPAADDRQPWLELRWPQPQRFNLVQVNFLTAQYSPSHFVLEARSGDGWQRLVEVERNRHRRHVFALGPTTSDRLRLVLLDPGREPQVAEIRVYEESEEGLQTARRIVRTRDLPDDGPPLPFDLTRVAPGGIDPRKLPGIVIDDEQARREGHWVTSDHTRPFIGIGYSHDGNSQKGTSALIFEPRLKEPGVYEVRLAYSPGPNRAKAVPVTIDAADGPHQVRIDERPTPPLEGVFISLGTFRLNSQSRVTIHNEGTAGYVAIDALQLLPAGGNK